MTKLIVFSTGHRKCSLSFNDLLHSFIWKPVDIDFSLVLAELFGWRRFPWLTEHRNWKTPWSAENSNNRL